MLTDSAIFDETNIYRAFMLYQAQDTHLHTLSHVTLQQAQIHILSRSSLYRSDA